MLVRSSGLSVVGSSLRLPSSSKLNGGMLSTTLKWVEKYWILNHVGTFTVWKVQVLKILLCIR